MEQSILTEAELRSNIERFATYYSSQTNKGTFRTTGRNSLLNSGLGTRANSIWKMAEYIIATYEETPIDKSFDDYLQGWHSLSKNFRDQYLFLEVEPNKWNLYDWSGKLLNDTVPIETFFLTKEKERNQLLEKLGDSENVVAEEILSANSFRQFVKLVLLHLYKIDSFECFFDKLKKYTQSDIEYRWVVEGSNIYFRADNPAESGFWEDEFVIDGTSWYLNNGPKADGYTLFAAFINQFYPEFYAEKRGTQFFLYCAPKPYANKDSRQVIYYGAPGTGKSFEVKKITNKRAKKRTIRTTFHPDTDYSSFVGCFKPKMNGKDIEYRFVPQAFARAYVNAWKDLSKPFFLVIEEINRGNCAQIFGDIFQLLDREITGESSYAIQPDYDLQEYIKSELSEIPNIPFEIASGEDMSLPPNFYIYATMNTSDQSLFPIDSAFKRRWDMRYTAIKPGVTDHTLNIDGTLYSWNSFISKVNKKIYDLTKSEDKQLGFWFIKPDDDGFINWNLFVSKALFYIWNDVVKDYATMEKEDSPFSKKFAFSTFFDEHGNPMSDHVVSFLDTLGVEKKSSSHNYPSDSFDTELASEPESEYSSEEEIGDDLNAVASTQVKSTGSQYSYVLNGVEYSGIGKAIISIVNKLGENYTFDEIAESFNRIVHKTYKKEPAIKAQHPSELNPDENGRNRWYVNPFKDKNGKIFSLISLWPDSYFDRIKAWVNNYPELFPKGFAQIKNTTPTDE